MVVLDRSLLLVSGKGGVGKSAVSVALALRAARLGKRVLLIGLVDALGLAEHLGTEHLNYRPRRIHPGVFAIEVDRPNALDEYLRLQLHVPRAAPTKQITKALNVLVETAPGIRELISIGKPLFEVWRKDWDLVIVDAPPIGQLASYLRAPKTIAELVPAGAIQAQAMRMSDTLADSTQAGLVLVVTPEELPVGETLEALDHIGEEGQIDIAAVVTNRVLPALTVSEAFVEGLPRSHQRDAAVLHRHLYDAQQHWLSLLPPGRQLPYLFGLITPGEVAAQLADAWEEGE